MPAAYSIETQRAVARARLESQSLPVQSGCIEWAGRLTHDGYSRCFAILEGRREHLGHRVAFVLAYGPVPPGREVDHLCFNRKCVNPEHLQAITHAENVVRSDHKTNHRNTKKSLCIRGHALSGPNVRMDPSKTGEARKCRACVRLRSNNRYHARKAQSKEG